MANCPFVSIVICTYNRKNLLKACLNSISAMDYPRSCYEIIIVDGGSNDGTQELCKEFLKIRFVMESRFGLAYARNKGAELARSDIVVYTDDDCVVDKQWLSSLVAGFRLSESIVGVGGPAYPLPAEMIPKKILVKPALGLYDEGDKVKLTQGLVGANFAFKREIVTITRFDETLGRANATRNRRLILSGEDDDFCRTLIRSGHKLLYVPTARVYHQIPKDRIRVSYIVKHAVHNGISMTRVFEKEKNSRIWMIRFAVGGLVQSLLSIISDRSFTSCYRTISSISTLFVCLTRFDKILLQESSN